MQFVLIDFENVQPANLDGLKKGLHHIRVFVGESQSKISLGTAKALQSFGSDADYIQIAGSGPNALDFHLAFYLGRLSLQHPQASFIVVSKDTGFDPLVKHLNRLGTACRRVASIATAVAAAPMTATAAATASVPKAATALAAASTPRAATPKPAAPTRAPAATAQAAKLPANPARAPAEKTPTQKPAATATKAPATSKLKPAAKTVLAPSDAMIASIVERLRGMKSARPQTLKTLTSSITSWHTLDAPRAAAVCKALVDGGHVTVDGKKLSYHFG